MPDDPIEPIRDDACPCLALLREIHALEKLAYLFQRQADTPGSAPEWIYAAAAVRDRLTWCRQRASVADPAVLGRALVLLHDEIATPDHPDPTFSADVPTGSRVQ